MTAVHKFQHREGARDADGGTRCHSGGKRDGFTIGADELLRPRGGRRRLAAIVGFQRTRRGIEVEQKSSPTDAGRLRLDEIEDLLRMRGVDMES